MFKTRANLRRHRSAAHGEKLNCPIEGCDYTYKKYRPKRLIEHLEDSHTRRQSPRPEPCQELRSADAMDLQTDSLLGLGESPQINLSDAPPTPEGCVQPEPELVVEVRRPAETVTQPAVVAAPEVRRPAETVTQPAVVAAPEDEAEGTDVDDDGPIFPRVQPIDTEPTKWEQQEDPRLAFNGAPSSYSLEHPSYFLRRAREEAQRKQPMVRYLTRNSSLIVKEEKAVLPDGVVYTLKSAWAEDPVIPQTRTIAIQTDRN